jgi:ribonuclease T2
MIHGWLKTNGKYSRPNTFVAHRGRARGKLSSSNPDGIVMPARLLAVALAIVATIAVARGHHDRADDGRFDYYLMSLSWSPSYCEAHPGDEDQCAHKGFGFVLHGLWPQNRDGSWPQHCSSNAEPDAATVERTLAFMPSRRLIEHEWQTHGSCTGLEPSAYFDLADRAFASVKIPDALKTPASAPSMSADEIVAAFAAANRGLDGRMVTVQCRDGGELSEVRVCLDRDSLGPTDCGGRVRSSCRAGALRIAVVR